MGRIADLLAWSPDEWPRELSAARLRVVANDLGAAVRAAAEAVGTPRRAVRLMSALESLSDSRLLAILRAPELYRVLVDAVEAPQPQLLWRLEGWIEVEQHRRGHGSRDDLRLMPVSQSWSALGDYRAPCQAHPWSWSAPTVGRRLPVDFVSPQVLREHAVAEYRPVQLGRPVTLTRSQRDRVLVELDRALELLSEICPPARALVDAVVSVVTVVRDDRNPQFFTSGSQRIAIGQVTLINPHLEKIDAVQLAGSMVHEAIHALLYMRELQEPIVPWEEGRKALRLRSPWTGAPLSVHTYVHACFVWYGLVQLWQRPGAAVACGEGLASLRERALQGFAADPVEPLRRSGVEVCPEILGELDLACERVRAGVGVSVHGEARR